MAAHRPRRLPAYALYGEAAPSAPDRLHCESIAERSRLHDWEIRPHRHESLCQLIVVESGRAQAVLDGRPLALDGPAVITVPALAAHGFVFAPAIRGHVFTMAEPHLAALLHGHAGLRDALLRLHGQALAAADADAVLAAAAALRDEALRGQAAWRQAALDAALLRLAVAVARTRPPSAAWPGASPASPALRHVQRLQALVEADYRRHPSQAELAARLNITPTQLNRACRQLLGHPAQGVLHARLLLQAQRELAYTELPIKQIAFELGFSDAAYFTRFFRRHAGRAPAAWRSAQRAAPAP